MPLLLSRYAASAASHCHAEPGASAISQLSPPAMSHFRQLLTYISLAPLLIIIIFTLPYYLFSHATL
jgi:hypothetical protein